MVKPDLFTYNQKEKRGFLQRFGLAIGLGIVAIGAILLGRQMFSSQGTAPHRNQDLVAITPITPPPPPPPPPPPSQQVAPKQEMMEQAPANDEAKPAETPDPSPSIGTNITGNGPPDGFGVGRNTGGNSVGGGGGKGGGSRFGWYASQVQRVLADALRNNPKTRAAEFSIKVRIWPDVNGHITRAKLASTTGNPAVDAAIEQDVLPGLQLQEPPPPGMPTPIVMMFTARRPN